SSACCHPSVYPYNQTLSGQELMTRCHPLLRREKEQYLYQGVGPCRHSVNGQKDLSHRLTSPTPPETSRVATEVTREHSKVGREQLRRRQTRPFVFYPLQRL